MTLEFKFSQTITSFKVRGIEYLRIPWTCPSHELGAASTGCPTCAVSSGYFHILPCEAEECPRCVQEAVQCACAYERRPHELLSR